MGNYCCSDNDWVVRRSKKCKSEIKRKSLSFSEEKFQYQKGILQLFNTEKSLKRNVYRKSTLPLTDIEIVEEIGSGGQGDIFKVRTMADLQPKDNLSSENPSFYALKRTALEPDKMSQSGLKLGTELLISHNSPFLTKSYLSTTSESYMYEIMELAVGGDLSQWLQNTVGRGDAFRALGEEGIKFIVSGIILGLEEIHRRGFVFRDLKTENILIGKDGYPMLSDFHLLGKQGEKIIQEIQGTVTYLAPELLTEKYSKQTLAKCVDLWSLGILIFMLAYGQPPFEPEEILSQQFYELCVKKQNKYGLKRKKISKQLQNLINLLLRVDPEKRLTITQIKGHELFSNFNWNLYQQKQVNSPLLQILKKHPIKILQIPPQPLIKQPSSPSKTCHTTQNNKTLSSSQQF